jgi:serine protease inhibitor
VARKSFRSDTKEVNFVKNPEKARKIINNWVEKRTRNKIIQMIGPGKYASHNNYIHTLYVYPLILLTILSLVVTKCTTCFNIQ